jgi:hypothetical protein
MSKKERTNLIFTLFSNKTIHQKTLAARQHNKEPYFDNQ